LAHVTPRSLLPSGNPAPWASGKMIGFGTAVPWPTRLHAYASPALLPKPSQGLLPARAGSPLAGRDLHPLDDEQSFMETSHPPIPFDQQGLVGLYFLFFICVSLSRFVLLLSDRFDTCLHIKQHLFNKFYALRHSQ